MPLVFGILAFVYSGHGVFPSVRASMKQPEDFPKVSFYRPGSTAENIMHGCNAEPTMHVRAALDPPSVIPIGWYQSDAVQSLCLYQTCIRNC